MLDDQEEEETQASQLSPVFRADGEISNEEFELTFLVTVPALGLQSYYLRELKSEDGPNDEMSVAKTKIFNTKSQPFQVAPFGSVELRADGAKFALSNAHVVAEFDGSGLLAAVTTLQDKIKTQTRLEFWEYGTTRKSDKSGAYLFLPDDQAKAVQQAADTSKLLPPGLDGLHPGHGEQIVSDLGAASGRHQRGQRAAGGDAGPEADAGRQP